MSFSKALLRWEQVHSTSTSSSTFFPVTMWSPASSVKEVRAGFEIALPENDITVAPAYQVANVENTVVASGLIGTYQSTSGVHYPSSWQDISTATDGAQLVRFGWQTLNTSTATRNRVRVGGFVQTKDS